MGWEQKAKLDARTNNRELLTPQAASALFGVSLLAVHHAVSENLVCADFQVRITTTPLNLIRMDSAAQQWGLPDTHLADLMRDQGQVIGIEGQSCNILSLEPLVTLSK